MSGFMHIGFARRMITPSIPCQLAGFDARKQDATGVHDDLHARVLLLADGEVTAVLVSVEVIAVTAAFTEAVRREVEAVTGIPGKHVLISATHTHCGPVTLSHFFNQGQPLHEEYLHYVAAQILAAVQEASSGKRARRLFTGLVPCRGIAVNRRTQDGLPVDPYAGVLLVRELNGDAAAILVNYACHTTVLGPDTLSVSQDFPFYTLESLREKLGGAVETLFFNGAEGDLSIGHKSDLSAVGIVDSFRNFMTAQVLGERLADAVLDGIGLLEEEAGPLCVEGVTAELPLKRYAPLAEMSARRMQAAEAVLAAAPSASLLELRQQALFSRIEEYYSSLYESSPSPEPKTLPVELTALCIGGTAMVSLPGEVFVAIGLEIRSRSPFGKTFLLGLTNDYIGYLPTVSAAASSGYEVVASRIPAEAAERLTKYATTLLQALKHRSRSARAREEVRV